MGGFYAGTACPNESAPGEGRGREIGPAGCGRGQTSFRLPAEARPSRPCCSSYSTR
jgi:hypothetical protein